jgi:hypothetical protein
VNIATAAKDTQNWVIRLALLNELKRGRVAIKRRWGEHIEHLVDCRECLAPEQLGQLALVKESNNQLSQDVVLVLSNAVLLRCCSDGVLAPNAVLREKWVPLMPNILTTLVLSEEPNDSVVLFLNVGLKLLKGVKCVALLLKQIDPAAARGVVDEGDPVSKAREHEYWYFVQIAVNAFKGSRGAIRGLLREWQAMMFAVNTGNANRSQGIVRVDLEASSKLMLQNLVDLVDSNVHKMLMPERAR